MSEQVDNNTAAPAEEPGAFVEMTYKGRRHYVDKSRKTCVTHVWQPLDENGSIATTEEEWWPKQFVHAQLGAVYTVFRPSPNTVRTGGPKAPKFSRRWGNEADITAWQALDEAARVAERAKRLQADEMREDALKTALKPICKAMRATDHTGRLAIKVRVLAILDGLMLEDF